MLLSLNPLNENEMWIAYPDGSNGNKVFKTSNGGTSWNNLSSAVLNNESPQALVHSAGTDGAVYLFTQFSAYYRNNSSSGWIIDNTGLPTYCNGNIGRPFYRDGKNYDAEITQERFIKLHPAHKDVAYAYYMRAIGYYEQITDISRDQKITEDALAALREVVQRFPNSPYARDAKIKIDLTQDHLAGKQLEIGRFYQKRGEYVAAINRFRDVVERYQTTAQVPEALHRLVETYLTLGITTEAQKYASVLGHIFPEDKWYKRSFKLLGKDAPDLEKTKDNKTFGIF
jgi:tetratricopeptide (TPR) repeat protein